MSTAKIAVFLRVILISRVYLISERVTSTPYEPKGFMEHYIAYHSVNTMWVTSLTLRMNLCSIAKK